MTELVMRSKQSNGYDDDFMEACREELAIREDHFFAREYWVAEVEEICGIIGLEVDASGLSGEACVLFVDPAWKRKGVGLQLWQTLVKNAKDKGLNSIRLDADPAAAPFYQALDLRTIGSVLSNSIPGRKLLHMAYDLE
ncbi:GNAT family N-acetyltransferase [Breoghania sp.]|uniref:GNAT family N-acetyltransferase n=1 Tax=Breoghania sp. TaxID=2065378 RepID=UPI0026079051|nr:GNAT family N-acetyltransferase [Breoghania sp.]MDJ0929640.1 GNAT family N-acetyltransferase [Breoghania sp.]